MAAPLDQINTIVLLMMENRSFDHMLGHLTLDDPALPVEGIKQEKVASYANNYNGGYYPLHAMPHDSPLETDLPHEADAVATQMDLGVSGLYSMHGFVQAYANANPGMPINIECIPMAYFEAPLVPITDFLAKNFCICDHWHAPIPTSTQPNRTMAFCGYTPIYQTRTRCIPLENGNIFQWMTDHQVRWHVYHDGVSFFAFYDRLWPLIFGDNFKKYEHLHADWLKAPDPSKDPQVIIIEPCYEDAPHLGGKQPNDNHAPLAVGWGEDFLRRTYQALTSNPARWANTLFVVYYDEHGGFFDHVPPAPIIDTTIGGDPFDFATTGPRIPGLVISPFVAPGSVCSQLLDHTSVLQLLAEKFTPGTAYSPRVTSRARAGIQSLSVALQPVAPSVAAPGAPDIRIRVQTELGTVVGAEQGSPMKQSFAAAVNGMMEAHPTETAQKFPELYAWKHNARG